MFSDLNFDVPSPKHAVLSDALRERVRSGELTGRLPSIAALSEQTGLAPDTVHKALKTLIDEGLLRAVPRLGTWVDPPK